MRKQTMSKANHASGSEVEEQKPIGRETGREERQLREWQVGQRRGRERVADCFRPFSSST